jgi:DNA polymerase-3 subunit epsilon
MNTKSNRQIVLDTETTGLSPQDGHRIIEIGAVELINRRPSRRNFHVYLNPQRLIDAEAIAVHGITNEFLQDKPRFSDIVDEFAEFIRGTELIIHNAAFDVGFINYEYQLLRRAKLEDQCAIFDTLALARNRHPGQRNSLDALCKRYNIDNSQRELHGALLDAQLLAEVYLLMTGGQESLLTEEKPSLSSPETSSFQAQSLSKSRPRLRVIAATADEAAEHQRQLAAIQKSSQGKCLWLNMSSEKTRSTT